MISAQGAAQYLALCSDANCHGSPFPVFLEEACQCNAITTQLGSFDAVLEATEDLQNFTIDTGTQSYCFVTIKSREIGNYRMYGNLTTEVNVVSLPTNSDILIQHSYAPDRFDQPRMQTIVSAPGI